MYPLPARAFRSGRMLAALGVISIATCTFVPSSMAATTRTVVASADAYVVSNLPTDVNGTKAYLRADATRTSYLKFTVPALATGETIAAASLELTPTQSSTGTVTVGKAVNGSWSDSTLTYNNRPADSGGVLASAASVTLGTPTRFNVLGGVAANAPVTFVLKSGSASLAEWNSREAASGQPKLVLTVNTAAPAAVYPKVASVDQNDGESWADACVRTMSYGYTGCVIYFPAGKYPSWNADLQALASKVGTKTIDLQVTAKSHSDAGLADVITHLPFAWKSRFIYNIYQEPEDNLTTATQQAQYRASYTAAAKITRQYGVSLPWVEWQEWTVNPVNGNGWNLASFTPPAADFGGVLWSLFEYGERDNVDAQVSRVKAAMAKYAPGKPWAMMAGSYTLEGAPITDTQKKAQAAWLQHAFTATKAGGSKGFAWYNVLFPGVGGAAGEGRLELNPYALPVFKTLA